MEKVVSPCVNKAVCGSCEMSVYSYEDQLQLKLRDINVALMPAHVVCSNIVASPKTHHYRNKMDYAIDFTKKVGLREKGKWWKVIDDHTCFLADPQIEKAFHLVRDWIKTSPLTSWDRKAYTGFLRYLVLRASLTGELLVTLVTSPPTTESEADFADLVELLKANFSEVSLVWSINTTNSDVSYGTQLETLLGKGFIIEDINNLKFKIQPNSFFQTNSYTAKVLLSSVVDMVRALEVRTALDLYCGTGFFTLGLANSGMKVDGVEVVADAIKDAKDNSSLNLLSTNFKCEKSEDLSWLHERYDLILVDPTRAGLHPKVLNALIDKRPKYLLYVSCNYKQLAAELPKLTEIYKVAKCFAIDQFPQTNHVEVICMLERQK